MCFLKFLKIAVVALVCSTSFIYGVGVSREFHMQDEGAFNAPRGSLLVNPQSNVARVYFLYPHVRGGADGTRSNLTIEYDPQVVDGHVRRSNYEDILADFRPGTIFYMDILPNTPIAITHRKGRVSYAYFTPRASKIYCVTGYPRLQLVDYRTCESLYNNLEGSVSQSRIHQREWRKRYVRSGNPAALDGKVFWLSYIMDKDDLGDSYGESTPIYKRHLNLIHNLPGR